MADNSEAPPSPIHFPVHKKFRAKLESKLKAKPTKSSEQHTTKYCEGMHLCVTATNAVGERWNSMANATLSKQWKGLSPVMVDGIICLKWNKPLGAGWSCWGKQTSQEHFKKDNKEASQRTQFPSPSKEEGDYWMRWVLWCSLDACLDDAEKEAPNKDNVDKGNSDDDKSMKESAIDLSGCSSGADDSEDSDSD